MSSSNRPPPAAAPSAGELLRRLRPGGSSAAGLLGARESLDAVLARDAATLTRLGLTYAQLADPLEELLTTVFELFLKPVPPEEIAAALARQTNFPILERPETIPQFDLQHLPDAKQGLTVGRLQVFVMSFKSFHDCPWGDARKGNTDYMILNRTTGDWVTAPELMPHLIRTHHFFGGLRSPYRTDPERLAKVLELVAR